MRLLGGDMGLKYLQDSVAYPGGGGGGGCFGYSSTP